MSNRDYITVRELNLFINSIFNSEELLHNAKIMGEVSDIKTVNGHCYFILKDQFAQIKTVIFNFAQYQYLPQNGDSVIVRGSIDYYQKNGQITLKGYEITPIGQGLLYIKYEELKKRLTLEGLFDEQYKKPVPKFPKNIAVVTSIQGAAIQDVLSTMNLKNSKQNVDVIDVRVQGEFSTTTIINTLKKCDEQNYDVILLTRGGGSFEDLFGYNDETLVRQIFAMKTPIISAVGHETDTTLCDFVADYRAITPTAGAEKVFFNIQEEKSKTLELLGKLKNEALNKLYDNLDDISYNIEILENKANLLLTSIEFTIKNLLNSLKNKVKYIFDDNLNKIQQNITIIEHLSPIQLLKRGYFRILSNNLEQFNLKNIKVNDEITVVGYNEKLTAKVVKKENV